MFDGKKLVHILLNHLISAIYEPETWPVHCVHLPYERVWHCHLLIPCVGHPNLCLVVQEVGQLDILFPWECDIVNCNALGKIFLYIGCTCPRRFVNFLCPYFEGSQRSEVGGRLLLLTYLCCLTMGLYCGIQITCKHKNCEHKVNWNWAWKFSNEDTLCITKTSRISLCRENMKFVAYITRMQNDVPRKLCTLPIEVANQVTGED